MSEQRINVELLAKVRDKILAAPESYDQNDLRYETDESPCGTAACIAGWAVALDAGSPAVLHRMSGVAIHLTARKLLRLDEDESCDLFEIGGERWPEPFNELFRNANNAQARAEVAASYINHIIKTGKVTA